MINNVNNSHPAFSLQGRIINIYILPVESAATGISGNSAAT